MAKHAIFIAGPTASGKTALSVSLAKALNGVIINGDSMQVYDVMQQISARPTIEEQDGVEHLLFGHIDPAKPYSTGDWHKQAAKAIEAVWKASKTPIIIGGTGMYFKTLTEGLSPIPDIDLKAREKLRARAAKEGADAMHDELSECDPKLAERLFPGDSQRVLRGLEVFIETGKPLSVWQEEGNAPGCLQELDARGDIIKMVLKRPRDELYDRINRRFKTMVDEGALDEVKALMDRDVPLNLPAMKALGVPSLRQYILGEKPLDDAIVEAQKQTRHYAKRQLTWFRQQFGDWPRIYMSGEGCVNDPLTQALDIVSSGQQG
jgi:tRNA dimethylallyltransferase